MLQHMCKVFLLYCTQPRRLLDVMTTLIIAEPCLSFIHSKRRNNLTPGRGSDLMYVFSNLRLAKCIQDLDCQEVVLD